MNLAIKEALDFIKKEKGLTYITIGNIGSALLGAFFWFILASILKVSEYGEVNYYLSLVSIPVAIGLAGLNTTVTTYLAKGEEEIIYEANSIILILSLILALFLISFQLILSLILISMIFYGMALAEIIGKKLYDEYTFVSLTNKLIQIVLSILLYFKYGLIGILIGYFLGYFLLSYRYLKSLSKFTLKINNLRNKLKFILHSYGLNLIGNLSSFLDKIIIGTIFGFYVLGLYQLGYQFLVFLMTVSGSFYTYLLPEEASGENKKEVKLIGLILSIVIATIIFLFSPLIIKIFFPNFISAIQIVQIMSLSVIPATITSISNARLFGKEKSKYTLIGGIIYLISLIIGIVFFGKILGIIGLAFSIIFAQMFQAIYLWRKAKISFYEK
jgi:O-antigen/teichoic acid export membrane protein